MVFEVNPFLILPCLVVILFVAGLIERHRHAKALSSIPIRVHVNGTRGKSSVTRLIAAGLRAGGIRTIAKTTGSAAMMLWEDGSETPVIRHGPPNIREQIRVITKAAEHGAQALVVECMALQPDYQRFTEHKVMRSTHGVITNVRADHLDVMGPTVRDVAHALSNTIPKQAVAYTAEHRIVAPLLAAAKDRKTILNLVEPREKDIDFSTGFSYLEHPENIALALAVCRDLGIPDETAVKGMWEATPDVGALQAWSIDFYDKKLLFVNAMAANDPESTLLVWKRARKAVPDSEKTIVLFNNRGDRLSRAQQFGTFLAKELHADHYILIGQLTKAVEDEAIRAGLDQHKISNLSDSSASEVFEKVLDLTHETSLVVAVGNLGGLGGTVASYFQHRGKSLGSSIGRSRPSN